MQGFGNSYRDGEMASRMASYQVGYPYSIKRALANPNVAMTADGKQSLKMMAPRPLDRSAPNMMMGMGYDGGMSYGGMIDGGAMHPMHRAMGAGFWDDFKQGFKSVFDPIGKPLLSVLPYGNLIKTGMEAVGLGKSKMKKSQKLPQLETMLMKAVKGGNAMSKVGGKRTGGKLSGGKPTGGKITGGKPSGGVRGCAKAGARAGAKSNDGRMKRAQIVKQVMQKQGLSLPQASKYVKEHNLY